MRPVVTGVVNQDLNVPAKGQEQFAKMFGESWEAALASGKVYNAAEACKVGALLSV